MEKVEWVSSMDVFNLPLFENFLVVDTRSVSEHEKEHITSSISFPPLPQKDKKNNLEREKYLIQFLLGIVERGEIPEHTRKVVFYGTELDPNSMDHAIWNANRLASISQQPFQIQDSILSESMMERCSQFQEKLKETEKFMILKGGYEQFKQDFPINCGQQKYSDMIPLPVFIAPGLFLGNRASNSVERRLQGQLALEREILEQLGIRFVVVNSSMPLPFEDSYGIECLRCPVEDRNDVWMKEIWLSVIEFIETGRKKGGNVLVQVYGRSRSSSFIIAWAIRVLHMTFEQAFEFVKNKCFYALDPSLMYIAQLKELEHKRIQ